MMRPAVRDCRLRFVGRGLTQCSSDGLLSFSPSPLPWPVIPVPLPLLFCLFLQTHVLLLASINLQGLLWSPGLEGADCETDVHHRLFLAEITVHTLYTDRFRVIRFVYMLRGRFQLDLGRTSYIPIQKLRSATEQTLPHRCGQA